MYYIFLLGVGLVLFSANKKYPLIDYTVFDIHLRQQITPLMHWPILGNIVLLY